MPDGPDFDIYETAAGYSAVTNPVRRAILDALAERDLALPDLVKLTGKSKPTLSNLHVRELLHQRLVEELPHATDARRKVYRLASRRIGRSNVPLDQLRGAVRNYVTRSPLAHALPFPQVVRVLVAAGATGAREPLRKQGVALGEATAHLFLATTARDALTSVTAFWDREGVARAARVDFDRLEVEVEVPGESPLDATAIVLAGMLEGVLRERGLAAKESVSSRVGRGRRATIALPRAHDV